MFEFAAGFVVLVGISVVSTLLLLALSVPGIIVLASILWLIAWPSSRARVPIPGRVMLPTACFVVIMLCGAAFVGGAHPVGANLQWLGWVAVAVCMGAAVASARIWVRADRDRRIAGLLLLQLVFVGAAGWLLISEFRAWDIEYLPVAVSKEE